MAMKATIIGREALQRRLDELVPEASAAAAKAKLEVAREAANRIAARAPVGATGVLKDSIIGARQADMPGAKAIGNKPSKDPDATGVYADFTWKFVEHGTAPHKITGRNGKNLVFTASDGTRVSTPSVNHPGSRAQPFVFYTWKAYRKAAKAKIARAIGKAVKASMGQ
ncbi:MULTISPECIES: HK97 gp10 family phage protein [unclassified Mesorhizobium]|uniref:HK97 gp10 family phage protein n=1 Tax=unclassified Mesorhizobium TaxID=325217 RepID=UPI000F753FA9|nr:MULTISPECIES: HK97 gp10 family phage protein [unclassified Mesorhizobium]AZO54859.1 HK97 gp10 family phage protein [Mesorhizobium sp. M8A.F.Ca.ET.057.01.1.1]RWE44159.1 MAG: HK97 gp10 family phage protein [Mesorhizobium sp.]